MQGDDVKVDAGASGRTRCVCSGVVKGTAKVAGAGAGEVELELKESYDAGIAAETHSSGTEFDGASA